MVPILISTAFISAVLIRGPALIRGNTVFNSVVKILVKAQKQI